MSTSPSEAIELIREAKGRKGLTWEQIATHVGRSPVYKGDRVKVTMCGKFLPYKKW